jgi:hypothetical protein
MANRPDSLQDYFRKRGVKVKSDTREAVVFVGKNANMPFAAMADIQASKFTSVNTDVAELGEAYASLKYVRGTTGERSYEDVYGKNDYTVAVQQDATSKEILDEVFGSNDEDPKGEIGISESGVKASLERTGIVKNALRSLIEKHRGLYEAQTNTAGLPDEESTGVRGVEDIGSPIEPIA